ncbi:hypothetical protein SAMN05518847_11024 [Paenibacillus sp. OV219]|nr:hypothetical protein SAMN05518847_11024 [Paenibacillus sp. OV219]
MLKVPFRNKKFFTGIYIWITVAICMIVTVFSASLYVNVKNNVEKNNYELNQ